MKIRIRRLSTITPGKLKIIDLHHLTWLPCLMTLAVVFNVSVFMDAIGNAMFSYGVLFFILLSLFLLSFFYIRSGKITWFLLMVILFQLLFFASSVINANGVKNNFYQGCYIVLIAMLCDYYKDRPHFVVGSFAIAFSVCAYLNMLHLIVHPELWAIAELKTNQGYLLGGNYNQMGSRLLCAVGISIACLRFSKWWLVNVIPVTIVSVTTLLIVGSKTSLTGIVIFLMFCLVYSRKIMKAAIIALMVGVVFFQLFVCFQGKGIEQNALAVYFIEDVLGKDITFTFRTYLWDAASNIFAQSPFIGYGHVEGNWYYANMSSFAKGPHNFIWSILVNGGIILLALFTYICYLVFSRLPTVRERYVLRLYALLAVLFVMMTMESYPYPIVFTLLSLAYFAPKLLPKG